MATSFQFEDLDLLGIKGSGGSSSPYPPSIVSLASDNIYTTFATDPEQYVPTSMADLFEGALCDDEIPSLLNLTPLMNPAGETLQLSYGAVPQEQHRAPRSPVDVMPATKFVPISPAPTLPEVSASSEHGHKRIYVLQPATSQQQIKKIKIDPSTTTSRCGYRPTTAQTLQPLTLLPASSLVSGRPKENGVDTSTAHIRALTGTNGPAVCLDAIEKALEESGNYIKPDGSASSTASADGKQLSAEEKARQSRDRNRQHARNTRVRKKAYVEELKRTLNQLVEERDTFVHQKRMEQQGISEQRDVRLRVIEDFLNLRGRNEADPNRWGLILEDGFCLRLPRADIPGVVCSSGGGNEDKIIVPATSSCHPYSLGTSKKSLTGVISVMEDASMVSSLLQSLGASLLSVSYQCDHDSFMMDNANVVVNWTATSSGAVTKGASAEFSIQGSLRASFNPVTNKLVSVEFSF